MKYKLVKWLLFFALLTSINSGFAQNLDSTGIRRLLFRVPHTNRIDSILYNDSITVLMPNYLLNVNRKFIADNGFKVKRIGLLGQRLNDYYSNSLDAKRNLNYFKTARIVGIIESLVLFPLFLKMEIDYTNEYNAKYSAPYPDIKHPPYIQYSLLSLFSGAITYHFIAGHFFRKSIREHKKSSPFIR